MRFFSLKFRSLGGFLVESILERRAHPTLCVCVCVCVCERAPSRC